MHRRLLSHILFTVACLYFTKSQAQELTFHSVQQINSDQYAETIFSNVYVQPSEIFFSENLIFVETPKGILQVQALKTDLHGIYYEAAHPQFWYCQYILKNGKKCGHYNTYTYYCENCRHAPDE